MIIMSVGDIAGAVAASATKGDRCGRREADAVLAREETSAFGDQTKIAAAATSAHAPIK